MLLKTKCGECRKEVQTVVSGVEEKFYVRGGIGKGFIKDKQKRFPEAVHSRWRKQPIRRLGGETRFDNLGITKVYTAND